MTASRIVDGTGCYLLPRVVPPLAPPCVAPLALLPERLPVIPPVAGWPLLKELPLVAGRTASVLRLFGVLSGRRVLLLP